MAHYDNTLIKRSAETPMTAEEIGEVVGCYGPDAVTRLRARKTLRVSIVGTVPSGGYRKKLYRVEKVETVAASA